MDNYAWMRNWLEECAQYEEQEVESAKQDHRWRKAATAITTLLAERDAALERERVLRDALVHLVDFIGPKDCRLYATDLVVREARAALSASGKQEVCGDA